MSALLSLVLSLAAQGAGADLAALDRARGEQVDRALAELAVPTRWLGRGPIRHGRRFCHRHLRVPLA